MRWPLGAMIGLLTFIGIAASATHYLYEPYNPGFLDFPTIVALHVILGGAYLVLAPFQFVRRIRSRHPSYHRWAGRALVSIDLVVGATALVKGFIHVRAGRAALHREWMVRAFAIGLSIATQRVIFILADPTDGQIATLSGVAFVVHASVAEAWICLTRKRGVPQASGIRAA